MGSEGPGILAGKQVGSGEKNQMDGRSWKLSYLNRAELFGMLEAHLLPNHSIKAVAETS